jgi:hypothetical protein
MPGDALRKALDDLGGVTDAVANVSQKQPTKRQARVALPGNEHIGRPTTYTDALGQLICDRIARGETLEQITDADRMPDRTQVYDWIATQPAFAHTYARAKSRQAEAIAEKAYGAAWAPDLAPQNVARARLRFDAGRWLAGKLDAMRWGDRSDLNISVTDPDAAARAAQQRAKLVAALERLAVAAPLTIDARPEDSVG